MALAKQGYNLNFAQGLDLKTDPNQVQVGKFLALDNAVFQNGGGLQKRNGFANVTTAPSTDLTTLATLSNNLVGLGNSLYAYNAPLATWTNKGAVQSITINTVQSFVSSSSQYSLDSATHNIGISCTTFMQAGVGYYICNDTKTGQVLVQPVQISATAATPKVALLGNHFLIVWTEIVGATPTLKWLAVPVYNLNTPTAHSTLSSQLSSTRSFDLLVNNNKAYIAWNGSDGGGAIRMSYINVNLVAQAVHIFTGISGELISLSADIQNSNIWVTTYITPGTVMMTMSVSASIIQVLAPTVLSNTTAYANISSIVTNSILHTFAEYTTAYPGGAPTRHLHRNSCTMGGSVSGITLIRIGVGLASKPFVDSLGNILSLVAYQSTLQPTYFLINMPTGDIVAKLAYSNGGGYVASGDALPTVSISNDIAYIPYLFKELIGSISKTNGGTDSQIYTQTGIKTAQFTLNQNVQRNSEIGLSLHISGGQLWQYDSNTTAEHGFAIWPEQVNLTAGGGGSLTNQQYYYQFTYEWSDANGLLHRSAPSVPLGVVMGANTSNTITIPYLNLTNKTNVRIVGYRWSAGQQTYYRFTSLTSPVLNNINSGYATIIDTVSDASILGNDILYTTGGVLENIAAPASSGLTLFKSRLFSINAENQNELWFSKQVLPSTPVEFSDFQTINVAPTEGAQGSTGPITALSSMDDKLIIFKQDAIYYMTGNGPDITGAQNDFSQPTYVTSTVGCNNANSIVLTPLGIMFQSDKGIWLLERNLSTRYIGAAVESYNNSSVLSAVSVPGTNQIRFAIPNGKVLMYDYYYDQWGTFSGINHISGCLWQSKHTILNSLGQVRQEAVNTYLDGYAPVLLSFTTAWVNLRALQAFQRIYSLIMLAEYLSPHKLQVSIAYDYDTSNLQQTIITPSNADSTWGDSGLWGSNNLWGGDSHIEQWRIFMNQQKCQAFQLTLNEIYDNTKGLAPGAGFTMSGINMLIGAKSTTAKIAAKNSRS